VCGRKFFSIPEFPLHKKIRGRRIMEE
jgi:hypothetical protein